MKEDNYPYRFEEFEEVLINKEVFSVIEKGWYNKEGYYHVKDEKGTSYLYHDSDMEKLESEENVYKYKIGQKVIFRKEMYTVAGYNNPHYTLRNNKGKYIICEEYEITEIVETKSSKSETENKKENTFILTTTEFIKINQEI